MPPKAQTSTDNRVSQAQTNGFSLLNYFFGKGTFRTPGALERNMDKTLLDIKRERQQAEIDILRAQKDIEESRRSAQDFRDKFILKIPPQKNGKKKLVKLRNFLKIFITREIKENVHRVVLFFNKTWNFIIFLLEIVVQ